MTIVKSCVVCSKVSAGNAVSSWISSHERKEQANEQ